MPCLPGGAAWATWYFASLPKALPQFSRDSVILDEVELGEMIRQVRGPGILEPQQVNVVSAEAPGSVYEIHVKPGDAVQADTVIMELRDPQMDRAVREARRALATAEASQERFVLQQASRELDLKVDTSRAQASYDDALSQADIDETLARRELISLRQYEQSRNRAQRNRQLLEYQLAWVRNQQQNRVVEAKQMQTAIDQARDFLD